MLKLIGDTGPVDMFGWNLEGIADSSPVSETATKAVFFNAEDNETYVFTGKGFTYDHGQPTGGTITGFEYHIGDNENFHVTGMKISVEDFLSHVGGGDILGLMQQVLADGDSIKGSALGDTLYGLDGDDIVNGGKGDDTITGGAGADTLSGSKGNDTFILGALSDSTNAAADTITDIDKRDTIDLSAIDASTAKKGDQAFNLVDAFTHHAGELVLSYDEGQDRTAVQMDVDGDGAADATLYLSGDQSGFHHFVF